MQPSLLLGAILFLATPATLLANDDFEAGTNPSGWSFNVVPPDVIESSGGNPGRWLHNNMVDSFAPIVTNDANIDSAFNGDFRAAGVAEIRVDAITNAVSITAAGREFSLLLRDTKGTPDALDDDYAYFVGSLVPQVGQGWVSYSFAIPSASTAAVPPGWSGGYAGDPENFRPGVDWNDVIQNVDRVEFWWLNPSFFAIFQQWDVGIDNVCIETVGTTFCDPANPNSTGLPTQLSGSLGSGIGSGLHLEAAQGPAGEFGYILIGTHASDPGVPISQGRLCLGTAPGQGIGRYNVSGGPMDSVGQFDAGGVLQNMVGTATSSGGSGFDVPSPIPSLGGSIAAGQTWHFQLWHREAAGASNSSNGLSVTF